MRCTLAHDNGPHRRGTWHLCLLVSLLCGSAVGCAPQIGDKCSTALDCSAQGSRICDRTQPGGYCTIGGCERGTCPDEAVCVKFRPEEPRLATTYCMFRCHDDGDCRTGRGYQCLSGNDFGVGEMQDAIVLDGTGKKFCGLSVSPGDEEPFIDDSVPQSMPDAGDMTPDAGDMTPDAGDDADAG